MDGEMDATMRDKFDTDAEMEKAFKETNNEMKITKGPISFFCKSGEMSISMYNM